MYNIINYLIAAVPNKLPTAYSNGGSTVLWSFPCIYCEWNYFITAVQRQGYMIYLWYAFKSIIICHLRISLHRVCKILYVIMRWLPNGLPTFQPLSGTVCLMTVSGYVCCLIWYMWSIISNIDRRVSMLVPDGVVPIKHQGTCNHHDCLRCASHHRSAPT